MSFYSSDHILRSRVKAEERIGRIAPNIGSVDLIQEMYCRMGTVSTHEVSCEWNKDHCTESKYNPIASVVNGLCMNNENHYKKAYQKWMVWSLKAHEHLTQITLMRSTVPEI